MNKRVNFLLISFVILVGLIIVPTTYLFINASTSYAKLFIVACGEILNNIKNHFHIDEAGATTIITLATIMVGIILSLLQIIKFLLSNKILAKKYSNKNENVPNKLKKIIKQQNLNHILFHINNENKLIAYTIGIIKPKIVLSLFLIKKMTPAQLEAIVLHELYHVKKRHVMWLFFIKITSSLLFFIPLISYLAKQLKTEFEIAADSFVVNKQKTYKHLSKSLAFNLKYSGNHLPNFANLSIEKRVDSLTNNKIKLDKIKLNQLIVSLTSIIFISSLILTRPKEIANSINDICSVDDQCQTTNCTDHQNMFQKDSF